MRRGRTSRKAAAPRAARWNPDEPEKRRAILRAAVRVFAEKGYHGCRIADVARQAGVAYGLVYHYFHKKDDLLESVFAEQWLLFIEVVRAIREGPGSASERIAGICRFAVDVFQRAPAAVRVLLLEVGGTPNLTRAGTTQKTFESAVALVAELVREGQESGELRIGGDPTVAAAGLLGALELCLTAMVIGLIPSSSEAEVERVKAEVVEFVLQGIRGPPPQEARAVSLAR